MYPTHSSASFDNELTHAGYKHVPVSYLVCEGDGTVTVNAQKEMIQLVESVTGNKVDVTTIKSGHVPIFSAPQDVVAWVVRLVEMNSPGR